MSNRAKVRTMCLEGDVIADRREAFGVVERGATRLPQRRSRRTSLIVAICFFLWIFGLSERDLSSLELLILAFSGMFVLLLATARRGRVEHSRRLTSVRAPVEPRTCVVIRRLGEATEPASLRRS